MADVSNNGRAASPGARFRAVIAEPETTLIPGCYDVLSCRLFERLGYKSVWAGGFMSTATQLGMPDANVITMTEHATFARNIALTVDVPVIADIDNGYGNAINVRRAVREFERAGVAAVVLEDQVAGKRCALYPGSRAIVSIEEMVGKIRAAADARSDMVIVARTDSFGAGLSVADAVERAAAYADAGAEVILPISKQFANLSAFAQAWEADTPLIIAPTLFPDVSAVEERRFAAIVQPLLAAQAALKGMSDALVHLRDTGKPEGYQGLLSFEDVMELVGLPDIAAAEERYLPAGSSLYD